MLYCGLNREEKSEGGADDGLCRFLSRRGKITQKKLSRRENSLPTRLMKRGRELCRGDGENIDDLIASGFVLKVHQIDERTWWAPSWFAF